MNMLLNLLAKSETKNHPYIEGEGVRFNERTVRISDQEILSLKEKGLLSFVEEDENIHVFLTQKGQEIQRRQSANRKPNQRDNKELVLMCRELVLKMSNIQLQSFMGALGYKSFRMPPRDEFSEGLQYWKYCTKNKDDYIPWRLRHQINNVIGITFNDVLQGVVQTAISRATDPELTVALEKMGFGGNEDSSNSEESED